MNNCPETLLFGASGPSEVSPSNGNWNVNPGGSISISIPLTWLHTQDHHHRSTVGPRFWARTGCKYDVNAKKAQCETGDCGNYFDCSKAKLAGKAPTSLAEFCFECGDSYTYYDVSLVDGYSVGIDIVPGEPYNDKRPGDPTNPFWCPTSNLCNHGTDMRSECSSNFTLYNSDLSSYNPADPVSKIACFSNCGKYEYPFAPSGSCSDSDFQCRNWRRYCCQATTYGHTCHSDLDCTDGGACWNGTCQCKAYYRQPPCSHDICTNPQGQPFPGVCTDCLGDDVMHQTCPRAYTWPNDPQTYSCNAVSYTITFCPGGTTEKLTPASTIPMCSSLPADQFDWAKAQQNCAQSHGKYMCAVRKNVGQNIWACNVDSTGCNDVICMWG